MTLKRFLGATAAALALASLAPGIAAAQTTPPAATEFARLPAISNVSLSPDGKHIVALTSPDGARSIISIWRTDAMDQAPFNIGTPERIHPMAVQFVKNDRIVVVTRQLHTRGTERTHIFQTGIYDLQGKEVPLRDTDRGMSEEMRYLEQRYPPEILSALPNDPQHILIMNQVTGAGDIYKLNVYTGARERVERGSDRYNSPQVDLNGEVRARQSLDFDNGNVYIAQFIKHPDTGAWEEHFRWYAKDREPMSIVGFTRDPNIVFLATNRGRDKAAIYEYNVRERRILEPAFEHKLFDANDVIQSVSSTNYGELLGFSYTGARGRQFWIDEQLAAIDAGLRQALGIKTATVDWVDPATGERARFPVAEGADLSIVDYSDDLKYVLVVKSGPDTPPEYYLLTDGSKLQLLGRSRPTLTNAKLGETQLVQYQARDGLMVPGFLTTPPKDVYGEGPYPTIILPHGGPWSRDNLDWDPSGWTQYFAARGYAVMQPQFRGSQGWGQRIWRAGDREWGGKMQDDKDDAAKWLIAEGIADPQRIAMHGYSYGGYSAMTAAVRPNGLYQCAIAGAGPSTMDSFKKGTFQSRFLREFQNPTAEGMDPLRHIDEVSIPVMLYHGDRDTNVVIKESERFADALRRAGKPVEFLPLEDMGHGYVTWTPEHTALVLTSVENYLRTQCGPGGL